ncbi:hypothetical protein [Pigmentiphaga kullae]|uniref:Uncharacterized protein n=1 Tax=Pigmentiphaga kullae TaxID=151784 RepID=A0A4V2F377_9BURK|nr:hypothetical protein [Pigmentiphaga kullae]RZS81434.1 hypothetical protein EV675_4057 [Pigmentiphaga kullae]
MRVAFGKLRARLATGIGSTIAVCAATVYGILGAAPPPAATEYTAGSQIEAGQWQVIPRRAWVSEEKKVLGVRLQEGERALVVEADLNNRTQASTRDYAKLLKLHPVGGVPAPDPEVALVREARPLPLLHPGLAERVAFVWKLPASAVLPTSLDADVIAKTYKPVDNLYGTPGWFNPRVVGRITMAVEATESVAGRAS